MKRRCSAARIRRLEVLSDAEAEALGAFHRPVVRNHRGWEVGDLRPVFRLEQVSAA
jgi:hypothetical protein